MTGTEPGGLKDTTEVEQDDCRRLGDTIQRLGIDFYEGGDVSQDIHTIRDIIFRYEESVLTVGAEKYYAISATKYKPDLYQLEGAIAYGELSTPQGEWPIISGTIMGYKNHEVIEFRPGYDSKHGRQSPALPGIILSRVKVDGRPLPNDTLCFVPFPDMHGEELRLVVPEVAGDISNTQG